MTIAHKTGLIALTVALMVAALLLPPTSASANEDVVDDAVFGLVGTAHLSDGINSQQDADGCLGGVATGGGTANGGGLFVAPNGTNVPNAGAQFTYNNTEIQGDAKGDLWINGLRTRDDASKDVKTKFDWLRAGTAALVFLGTDGDGNTGNEHGVAVATLTPLNVNAVECVGEKKDKTGIDHHWAKDASDVHVQIAGVGVILSALNP